ncbi:MAG: uracil-DNA glycosylase family 4 [Candidatus Latescibacterota bacterium]|jgi:uracil-DNA glycosylase family 4
MDEAKHNSDPIRAARRYLEDLEIFEGRTFIVPDESVGMARVISEASAEDRVREETAVVERALVSSLEDGADRADSTGGEIAPVQTEAKTVENAGDGSALELFRQQICECKNCRLGATRSKFVFGAGRVDADIMFVGEAPGADEDRSGEPFVGAAGQLLNKIIEAMGLAREDVFICNILKCRPPNNRDPQPDEIEECEPYLKRQIELIQPRVICTLGRFAAQTLLRSDQSMGRLRQEEHRYEGIPLIATYHPAALLRNAQWKRPTWEDMKKVRRLYDGVEL